MEGGVLEKFLSEFLSDFPVDSLEFRDLNIIILNISKFVQNLNCTKIGGDDFFILQIGSIPRSSQQSSSKIEQYSGEFLRSFENLCQSVAVLVAQDSSCRDGHESSPRG